MKVLVDCSLLVKGGGVQVGLGVVENAARTPELECHAVVSNAIAQQLSAEARARLASLRELPAGSAVSRYLAAMQNAELERRVRPDVVFSVFGPVPWKAERAPHLEGFALPRLIYPEVVRRIDARPSLRGAIADVAKIALTRLADYVVVETEAVRRRLESVLGVPSERVSVVRNSFSPVFAEALAQCDDQPEPGLFRVFVPSAWYPHKNLGVLPAAARALRDLVGGRFEFVFTLAPEEPGWQRLAAEAAQLGVGESFRTLGGLRNREMARAYRTSNAVCLPTLLECSTAVYPESLMAGVPIATSDVDFARASCEGAALYFDPFAPKSIAESLARLATDATLRTRLVDDGRSVLARNYPTPEQKWRDQLACLRRTAQEGKPTRRARNR